MCRCLAALQSMDKLFEDKDDVIQINLGIASDCLGVTRKLENACKVVSMCTKSHPIIREFLALKLKTLSSIEFTKVCVHQDDINYLIE